MGCLRPCERLSLLFPNPSFLALVLALSVCFLLCVQFLISCTGLGGICVSCISLDFIEIMYSSSCFIYFLLPLFLLPRFFISLIRCCAERSPYFCFFIPFIAFASVTVFLLSSFWIFNKRRPGGLVLSGYHFAFLLEHDG